MIGKKINKLTGLAAGIFLCLLPFAVSVECGAAAGDNRWYFSHFTSSYSGLSFNNVTAVSQDSNGFIWISTEDGLNRFDGISFERYYKEQLGVNTDFITSLCPDSEGNMWIGTDDGVTFYSHKDDCFFPVDKVSDKGTKISGKVTQISIDRDGTVWMSVNGLGLFSYYTATGELRNWFTENGHTVLPANIRSFYIDGNGEFWLALYFLDLWHSGASLESIEPVRLEGWKSNDDIMAIVRNPSDNSVYLAAWQNGLCSADLRKGTFRTVIENRIGFRPTDLAIDRDKGIWLSTTGGLFRYDSFSGTVERFGSSPEDKFSLADENATAVFVDRSNGLWVGTLSSGLNYSAEYQRNFDKYYLADNENLKGCYVMDMSDDHKGRIWLASEKKGLLYLDTSTGLVHRYRSSTLPESIFSICCDADGVWLGSWSGIFKLDPQSGRITAYTRGLGNNRQRDNKIYKLFKTSSDEILVGTTLGMLEYDSVSDTFAPVDGFEGVFVTGMVESLDGNLWVSSYANGIYKYSLKDNTILAHYDYDAQGSRHLPANKIMSVYLDEDGDLWAGSYGGGIMRYDRDRDAFETFDDSVLKNNRIAFSLIRDEDGRVWAATSKGLVSFEYPLEDIRYYTVNDGLLDEIVDGHTAIRASDGTMFFSSHNGVISFNPRRFHTDNRIPPIMLTDFFIGGNVVKPGAGSPISTNINETQSIVLTHRQNSFGFSMVLLGFSSPASNRCFYRLEGYDKDWNHLDGKSFHYSNVPAGKYTLQIRGIDGNGLWNDSHPPVQIVVKEVFYKSTLAYIFYVLFTLGLVWGIVRYASTSAVKQERKRSEKAKRQREEELFHEKMNFFSSIIHEIKTPLTLIRTPLDNIMAAGGLEGETLKDLEVIGNSTDYLDKLVKELLDFIRIEEHGWVLEYKQVDIIEKIGFLYYNFKETARSKNLRMSFEHSEDRIVINVDEASLLKMLNNLIHNAVKYAETFIDIKVSLKDGFVEVSFVNDGPAIPAERREEIFKPFIQYSAERQPYSQSFGIGLPLARTLAQMHGGSLTLEGGEYTDFLLRLPVGTVTEEAPEPVAEALPAVENDGRLTVLVVEDNVELADYLVRKLNAEYSAVTVPSAEKALELLERKDVDIILSDIALQGMSGIELCSKVTSELNSSHIPVVMLSALSSSDIKVKCMEAGASLYIEKPFSLDYLLGSLRVIAGKRESFRNAHLSGKSAVDPDEFAITNTDSKFLKSMEKAIMDNLNDPEFGLEQLAEAMIVSRSTLIRKVKGLLNVTPNEYIKVVRLNVAATMLSNGADRINDVCYAVGFNTPSYFAKCFKKQFGRLPADYMKEHRGE